MCTAVFSSKQPEVPDDSYVRRGLSRAQLHTPFRPPDLAMSATLPMISKWHLMEAHTRCKTVRLLGCAHPLDCAATLVPPIRGPDLTTLYVLLEDP